MPVVKVELPKETFEKLLDVAQTNWRPPVWQAEWLLKNAIEAEAAKTAEDRVPIGTVPDDAA